MPPASARFDWLTDAPLSETRSPDPIDSLPPRQALILIARAHAWPYAKIADALGGGISKQTVALQYQRAAGTLAGTRIDRRFKRRRHVPHPSRPYACPTHGRDCDLRCAHLTRWLAALELRDHETDP